MEQQPPPAGTLEHANPTLAPASNRRLYRRYPAGLAAVLAAEGRDLPCFITDISLGGVGLDVGGSAVPPAVGAVAELRSPAMAGGRAFRAEVRQLAGSRVHLSFELDDAADFDGNMEQTHLKGPAASPAAPLP
jgi:hypothetical protein